MGGGQRRLPPVWLLAPPLRAAVTRYLSARAGGARAPSPLLPPSPIPALSPTRARRQPPSPGRAHARRAVAVRCAAAPPPPRPGSHRHEAEITAPAPSGRCCVRAPQLQEAGGKLSRVFGLAVDFSSKQFRDRALSTCCAHRLLQRPRIDAFYFGAGLPAEEIKMFLFFFFFFAWLFLLISVIPSKQSHLSTTPLYKKTSFPCFT